MDDPRIAAILNAGLVTTTLPSGLQVRGTLPGAVELIQRGLMPANLRESVDRAQTPDSDMTDEQKSAVGLMWIDARAAAFMAEARLTDDEPWRTISVSPDQFALMGPADKAHLRALVRRGGEVAALEPFREERRGAADGADGGPVEDEAERDARRA